VLGETAVLCSTQVARRHGRDCILWITVPCKAGRQVALPALQRTVVSMVVIGANRAAQYQQMHKACETGCLLELGALCTVLFGGHTNSLKEFAVPHVITQK
jgi:hypothetical protein